MIRGIVFDFDGTLLDSMGLWETLPYEYLQSKGKETTENLVQVFQSFTMKQSAIYYKEHYGVQGSVDSIIKEIEDLIAYKYANELLLKPKTIPFLKRAKDLGISMCIATTSNRSLVQSSLKHHGISEYFECILTCLEYDTTKEESKIYEKACEALRLKKSEVLVIEDNYTALKTAHEAGFRCCAIQDAYESRPIQEVSDLYMEELDFSKIEGEGYEMCFDNRRK